MKYTLEIYGALCATSTFIINGVGADSDDFGSQGDTSPEMAEDYACGNMQFEMNAPTEEVLSKYSITKEEYETIGRELEEKLSFGCCGWCV